MNLMAPWYLHKTDQNRKNFVTYRFQKTGRYCIGRAQGTKGCIPLEEDFVSKEHLEILIDEDSILQIRDLRSWNGSFLNGLKIQPDCLYPVKEGDFFSLGKQEKGVLFYPSRKQSPPQRDTQILGTYIAENIIEVNGEICGNNINIGIGNKIAVSSNVMKEYCKLEELNAGGQGEVCLYFDKMQKSLTAFKSPILYANQSDEEKENRKAAIQAEADFLAQLGKHTNIIEYSGCILAENIPFLKLEFIKGPTLDSFFKDQKFSAIKSEISLKNRVIWITEIADALKYLHAVGLAHRDVKPSNILLKPVGDKEYTAILADFGIAHQEDQTLTMLSNIPISLDYASPERYAIRLMDENSYKSKIEKYLDDNIENGQIRMQLYNSFDSYGIGILLFLCIFKKNLEVNKKFQFIFQTYDLSKIKEAISGTIEAAIPKNANIDCYLKKVCIKQLDYWKDRPSLSLFQKRLQLWLLLADESPDWESLQKTMLSDSKSGSSLFCVGDFKEPSKFIGKLKDVGDPVSVYLKGKLSGQFHQKINEYKDGTELSKEFLDSLVAEFNRLLEIPFYQQEKFTSIKLSNETQRLLALKDIKKEERIKLNRFLLEDSYPQEIAKSLKSFPLDELDAPLKAKLAEKIYKSRPPFWGGHIIPFSELPQEQKGNAILFWIPSPEEDKGKILWEEEPGVLWDNVFLSFPVAALGMGQNLEIPENNKTPLPGDSSLWALYTKALVALQEGKIAEFQENAKKIQAQPAKYPWLANALFQLEQRFVWKTQKKAMEDDITQKQKDLQEQEKKSQSLQNEIQSKEQEMKTLNSEKQLLENDLKAKEQETKKLNSEKQKLEKDIVQKQQELEDQKKQSEEKIQDLQKEIQYLQTQISQTQSQKNTIQEQINSKTKEIQSLKQTQEDWQKKLKENFKKWPEAVRQGTFQKT
ncbi:MAG: protein kinase [Candidatus Brocadiae bacterium]|nr:protein kinase [Candidatus Brocadiia bacterium]